MMVRSGRFEAAGPNGPASDPSSRLSVLVTHADEPLGRCVVRRLYQDERVDSILAVGDGPPPRAFDRYLATDEARVRYARTSLTRQRSVAELFRASEREDRPIQAVVYIPRHAETPFGSGSEASSGVPTRTTEARIVLQHSLASGSIRQLIALGSAFVYRLESGNSTLMTEESELDLAPDLPAEDRAWVDSDMLFHGELHNDELAIALLRIPTVVGSDGRIHLNPVLSKARAMGGQRRLRPLGFDPMCALVADEDVAMACQLALHRRAEGIFNIAGPEVLPLSRLERCLASNELRGVIPRGRLGGRGRDREAAYQRYGFALDTRRARALLGFRPAYRVAEDGLLDGRWRLDATPA